MVILAHHVEEIVQSPQDKLCRAAPPLYSRNFAMPVAARSCLLHQSWAAAWMMAQVRRGSSFEPTFGSVSRFH